VNEIATLGIDLAKSVFQLHGVSEHGKVVLRKQVRRAQLLSVVAQIPPCLIGMEACGSSQHWRRELEQLGHQVRLMSPQYVKPYVKSQKNDQCDAEAICEAVRRPNMRFVQPKSLEQQDLQSAHRVRQGLMAQRTAVINRLRGMLYEYGIVMARRPGTVRRELPEILGSSRNGLTSVARELIQELHEHFAQLEKRIQRTEQVIERLGEAHDTVRRTQGPSGTVVTWRPGWGWCHVRTPAAANLDCWELPSVGTNIFGTCSCTVVAASPVTRSGNQHPPERGLTGYVSAVANIGRM
jgi:transposase